MRPKFENFFYYDGVEIRWLNPTANRVKRGDKAGSTHSSTGYRYVVLDNKKYLAHRVIWYLKTGVWPKQQLDHRDGNRINNRWSNLRKANYSLQQANKKLGSNSTSGYKGVCWHKHGRRWCAMIEVNQRQIWLGTFNTPKLAHAAYLKAAKHHFGEYARAR